MNYTAQRMKVISAKILHQHTFFSTVWSKNMSTGQLAPSFSLKYVVWLCRVLYISDKTDSSLYATHEFYCLRKEKLESNNKFA